jgi:hypothetical protein
MLEKRIYNNYHNQTNPKTNPNKKQNLECTKKNFAHKTLTKAKKKLLFKTRPKEGN